MNIAHVLNGKVVAVYDESQQPLSFKGKLLPFIETPRPAGKVGSKWSQHYEVFEDRVELLWFKEVLTASEQETVDNLAETSRIREVMAALRTGEGTAAERLVRLERVVGHLCKLNSL
jgi:hypothetical protein